MPTKQVNTDSASDDKKYGAWVPSQCWQCLRCPCAIEVHRVDGVAVNIRGNRAIPGFKIRTRNRDTACLTPLTLIQNHYHEWLPIRPGTDLAFMLAMLNTSIHDQLTIPGGPQRLLLFNLNCPDDFAKAQALISGN
jgi:anaerobic selenocysteine-containing dehydrogenase